MEQVALFSNTEVQKECCGRYYLKIKWLPWVQHQQKDDFIKRLQESHVSYSGPPIILGVKNVCPTCGEGDTHEL